MITRVRLYARDVLFVVLWALGSDRCVKSTSRHRRRSAPLLQGGAECRGSRGAPPPPLHCHDSVVCAPPPQPSTPHRHARPVTKTKNQAAARRLPPSSLNVPAANLDSRHRRRRLRRQRETQPPLCLCVCTLLPRWPRSLARAALLAGSATHKAKGDRRRRGACHSRHTTGAKLPLSEDFARAGVVLF